MEKRKDHSAAANDCHHLGRTMGSGIEGIEVNDGISDGVSTEGRGGRSSSNNGRGDLLVHLPGDP